MQFINYPKMKLSKQRRFLGRDHIDDHLELHRADCLGSHRKLDLYDRCIEDLEAFGDEPVLPPPLIGGRDLIALGLQPGPSFGALLERVRDAQLEQQISTREEALAMIREQAKTSGET